MGHFVILSVSEESYQDDIKDPSLHYVPFRMTSLLVILSEAKNLYVRDDNLAPAKISMIISRMIKWLKNTVPCILWQHQ